MIREDREPRTRRQRHKLRHSERRCGLTDLTVVVTTSPVPSNPSTRMIRRALASVDEFLGTGYHLLIACDGCPTHGDIGQPYFEYKRRLRSLFGWRVYESPEFVNQAGVVKRVLPLITTPHLLLLEHDFEFVRRVPAEAILAILNECPDVKYVRLNKRANHEAGWDRRLVSWHRAAIPLLQTSCFSANPHFARVSDYRDQIAPILEDGQMLENCVMSRMGRGWELVAESFDAFQYTWGTYLYGALGDPPAVRHLDGRHYRIAGAGSVQPRPRLTGVSAGGELGLTARGPRT